MQYAGKPTCLFFKHFNQVRLHRLYYGFYDNENVGDDEKIEFDAPWAPNQPNYESGENEEDEFEGDPSFCYAADGNGDWVVAVDCVYPKSVACEELGYLEGYKQKRDNIANLQEWGK